jgi:uncharacterized protein
MNMPLEDVPARRKAGKAPPYRLLALDGGGIRGLITIEILAHIEGVLRKKLVSEGKLKTGQDFVLADYFDYIAGTSTGAIIAACLSWGMPVERIRSFYLESGPRMFSKASLLDRLAKFKYDSDELTGILKREFWDANLGTGKLKTLLMMVLSNATTDSPWTISNNPFAKYNDPSRPDCNLSLPLWQLIRASTAAPTYFPPETIQFGNLPPFVFKDGGMTMFNNPAFQLFMMATLGPYRLNWEAGEEKMLLVSVGTGAYPEVRPELAGGMENVLQLAQSIPSTLMYAALNEQDFLCRVFGKCLVGDNLDRERGSLVHNPSGHLLGTLQHTRFPLEKKLFTYLRYNVELTEQALKDLRLDHINPKNIRSLDSVEHLDDLSLVGETVGRAKVMREHFEGF